MTPPQALRRSRAKRINSSPLESSSLSASKILHPSGPKSKRLRCEQKDHLSHKNVRELLQNQNRMDRDYEADFFSIFEPDMNPSTQDSQLAVKISTPEHSKVKQGFLHKFHEKSSSGHKKPLSRLSSCGINIVSPPVLKQVKNRALHEKYIDQLHCREARRKAAYARAGKSAGKKNRGEINVQKIDVVRAAKNSLVSDVRDALNHLHDLQANASSSSDFDDDGVSSDDDGGESGLWGNCFTLLVFVFDGEDGKIPPKRNTLIPMNYNFCIQQFSNVSWSCLVQVLLILWSCTVE